MAASSAGFSLEAITDLRLRTSKESKMANPEHLAKLKEGIEIWNEWRKVNKDVRPNLTEANLSGLDLHEANFSQVIFWGARISEASLFKTNFYGADLRKVNLREANLSGANLSKAVLDEARLFRAKLSGANLKGASLKRAKLFRANLNSANLSNANLIEANLRETDFREANLSKSNLSRANLNNARLVGANLSKANLSKARLREARLSGANLQEANLQNTNFFNADLFSTNLSKSNLKDANLSSANLFSANLYKAELRDAILDAAKLLNSNLIYANLTGSCIQDWNINNLTQIANIICDYVYLKGEWLEDKQKYFLSDRRPSNPNINFAKDEFTKYIQKALETIDLIFVDGIDWNAFFQSFQELQYHYDREEVSIQAIERKPGGAFVVRIETSPEADKAAIESQAKKLYEQKLQLLEAQYRTELHAKDREIAIYKEKSADMMEIARLLASKPITVEQTNMSGDQFNNNINNSTIANFANQVRDNANQTASQFSQTIGQNVDDIAKLIATLREQAQQFSTDQRNDLQMGIDDLERDLTTPGTVEPNRIKRRLIALFSALNVAATPITIGTDFVNNVLDLADKFGMPATELIQHVPPQLLP